MTVSVRPAGNIGKKSNANTFVMVSLVLLVAAGLIAWVLATFVRPGNTPPTPANTPTGIRGSILPDPVVPPDAVTDPDYAAAGNDLLNALADKYPSVYESLGDGTHPYALESWQQARVLVNSGDFTARGIAETLVNTPFTQDQIISAFNDLPLQTRIILTNPSVLVGAP